MKEHRHAEVLRAIADGKDVQCCYTDGTFIDWVEGEDCSPLDAHESTLWRVKPEPFAWLEGQDFYEVCQQYRNAKDGCVGALAPYIGFENLKRFIREKVKETK